METIFNEEELSESNIKSEMEIELNYNENIMIEPKLIQKVTRIDLAERKIIFDCPKNDVVLEVINIQNKVEIDYIKVTTGNVLITGYLNNCIMYTTMKRQPKEDYDNNCNSAALHGVLRHTTVWIPFKVPVLVAGAQEEDICTITSSSAINELGLASITHIYEEEYDGEEVTSIMIGNKEHKFIEGIISKNLIKITLNVDINHKKH